MPFAVVTIGWGKGRELLRMGLTYTSGRDIHETPELSSGIRDRRKSPYERKSHFGIRRMAIGGLLRHYSSRSDRSDGQAHNQL